MALNLYTYFVILLLLVALCPVANTDVVLNKFAMEKARQGNSDSATPSLALNSRTKRSPFILAFQVTRPPGLFQLSMRRPVIMGVMSNMTSMVLGSELAQMVSRGLSGSGLRQLFVPLNATSTANKT